MRCANALIRHGCSQFRRAQERREVVLALILTDYGEKLDSIQLPIAIIELQRGERGTRYYTQRHFPPNRGMLAWVMLISPNEFR